MLYLISADRHAEKMRRKLFSMCTSTRHGSQQHLITVLLSSADTELVQKVQEDGLGFHELLVVLIPAVTALAGHDSRRSPWGSVP